MQNSSSTYTARHISVLEGLEAVRKRPGMYIGSTDSRGLMHCLWEIIDNSVDEALAGWARHIEIILHADGSVEVQDDGRGIPVDEVPGTGLSGVEVVFTKLHAGGKFGGESYGSTGGLHGVGASVVNALSSRLDVEVDRGGKTHKMSFRRGEPGLYKDKNDPSPAASFTPFTDSSELRVVGKVKKNITGTRVRYWADEQIFPPGTPFLIKNILDRARQTAFLVPGITIVVSDQRIKKEAEESKTSESVEDVLLPHDLPQNDSSQTQVQYKNQDENQNQTQVSLSEEIIALSSNDGRYEFRFDGGTKDFVEFLSPDEPVSDIWHLTGEGTYDEVVQAIDKDSGHIVPTEVKRTCTVDIALRWGQGYDYVQKSFVNIIATPFGGTHVLGFERALIKVLRTRITASARTIKLGAKEAKIEKEDVLAGITAVITVRLPEPEFEGQTKEVLGTNAVQPIVAKIVEEQVSALLTSSKREIKADSIQIMQKIVGEMRARVSARLTKEISRRKNALESSSLPAKLADCRSEDTEKCELFIVEGDSALGTAKSARSSQFQALLPIRGKIINVQKASPTEILKHKEVASIIQVVGAGSGRTFDISQARYGKIIIMTDADVDGAHIRTLLITLFFQHMRPIVEAGRVYAAVPPLHRVEVNARGSKPKELIYTYSEEEIQAVLQRLKKEGRTYKEPIQRYKGLGEMDADQIAETTMDPAHRTLRRISMKDEPAVQEAKEIFELLMGSDPQPRKEFIVEGAKNIDQDRIDA